MLCSRLPGIWSPLCLVYMLTALAGTSNQTCCLQPPDYHKLCSYPSVKWPSILTPHCGRTIDTALPPMLSSHSTRDCLRRLQSILNTDAQAQLLHRAFSLLLQRYDCSQSYSIKFQCRHCQEAYRLWVCSTKIKYWKGSHNVKPCRVLCQRVEQKCPFFVPWKKRSSMHAAGEPSFLCIDPHIEENKAQEANSMYGADSCCYDMCEESAGGICLRGRCRELEREAVPLPVAAKVAAPAPLPSALLASLFLYSTRHDM